MTGDATTFEDDEERVEADISYGSPEWSKSLSKIQRQPISIKQIRTALHFLADGVSIPGTAVLSKQKFSNFLKFCEYEMMAGPKKKFAKANQLKPPTRRG